MGTYVRPHWRSQGLGRRLVLSALNHARQRPGIKLVQLTVTETNASAVALYESCGFIRFGAEPLAVAVGSQYVTKLPAEKRGSLTLDNGREFTRPIELERRLHLPIYFAHPCHAWERGTNENTNGLLRQYLPKGSDLSTLTNPQLHSHTRALNHRPRKCLGYSSPPEVFHLRLPR